MNSDNLMMIGAGGGGGGGSSNPGCIVKVINNCECNKKQSNSQFKLPHPNMIEMDEIKDSLSRKKPLLFLECIDKNNKDKSKIYVYVHKSIIWKAQILGIKSTLPVAFNFGLSGLKNKWIQYIKKIKAAEWNENKQEITVKIISPKI